MLTEKVEVIPYQEEWPHLFAEESKRIQEALGENCIIIHHIGSTAVPGLSAKPIIDMVPVVKNIFIVNDAVPAMEKIGYESRGEFGMLFRHFFVKRTPPQSFNIHVFEENNPDIDRHIQFRDWMRTHPDDKEAYQKIKINLALQYPNDILSYVTGKDAFVARIDTKIGFDGIRVVHALKDDEWDKVRYFRQKYIFDRIAIDDPYTSSFTDKNHAHLILYKGVKIAGYANIQFWPEERAILRILVIDELYRHKGLAGQFLKICERWLKSKKIRTLHIETTPDVYPLYINYGYFEMPLNDPDGHAADPGTVAIGKILTNEK
ncbi:MAG TPA: bifunctional GrpB family protein/GNAT family N-acetyltransferase [Gammaproteobacteria bacterium]|jgi:GrpB-like predicted nucleotidyltransferase (UPF0157 family)|nr:bifunctional GrpB family protein/GNAT family N-acetyltransferase [Gammaproteobacteria bacterium]